MHVNQTNSEYKQPQTNNVPSARSFAIITGASSGLGERAAMQLASSGRIQHAILIARSIDRLKHVQDKLFNLYQVTSTFVQVDLTTNHTKPIHPAIQQAVHEELKQGGRFSWLILAAGFGAAKALNEQHAQIIDEMLQVNCHVLTHMCREWLPILEANHGHALLFASIAAFIPQPYFAVYAATKAYVLSLAHALAVEHQNAHITAVCPNPVKTRFFDQMTPEDRDRIQKIGIEQADAVIRRAIKQCEANRRISIQSLKAKFYHVCSQICPTRLILWLEEKLGIYKNESK